MTTIGHNSAQFAAQIEALEEAAARLSKVDATNAGAARDAIADEVKVRKALDAAKADEKRPHLDANSEIEARYKPLLARAADAAAKIKKALTAYLNAEEAAARAKVEAARLAAEQERKRAQEAAKQAEEADDDPFARFDAEEAARKAQEAEKQVVAPARINVSGQETGAPALSLRTNYDVAVTDGAKLVAHFASNPTLIEEARKLAKAQVRAAKGHDCGIPGIEVVAERKVA